MPNSSELPGEFHGHESFEDEPSGFDSILDELSKNMEEAAKIPFLKRTIGYDIPNSNKRRGNSFVLDDRTLDYSFVSNSRSFSREYEEQLPDLVTIRPPLKDEIEFLEALSNPEYLQAVKDLSKPVDLRYISIYFKANRKGLL